jgi:hypothetical protein
MLEELVAPVLLLVVSFLLKVACRYLKIELDEKAFNSIVGAIVAFLLSLVFGAPIQAALFGS